MPWIQVYDPLGNPWLSTAAAAFPIVLLLVTLGVLEWKAHWAALTGLLAALAVATIVYGMPVPTAAATAVYGAAYGLLPIGWIIVNAIFLYNLTVETGQFEHRQGVGGEPVRRSPHPGAADRVFVRRVHRGRGRVRHAGRHLLRRCSWGSASRRSTPPAWRSSPTRRRSRSARSARRS